MLLNHKSSRGKGSFELNDQGLTWENEDQRVVAKRVKKLIKKCTKHFQKEGGCIHIPELTKIKIKKTCHEPFP